MVVNKELTSEQSQALKQVRKILKEILEPRHTDEYILRFLVARKFNVDDAVSMLEKHIQKFKENGYDKILVTHVASEKFKYFCSTVLGFDNEGSLVRYVASTDYVGLALSYSKPDMLRECVNIMENDLHLQKEKGKGTKLSYIIDVRTVSWRHLLCKQVTIHMVAMLKLYEANYPETLKVSYYINTPPSFEYFFALLSKYLPHEIMSKIRVLNSDEVESTLTGIMDPSILPVYLGGKRISSDGDIYCSSLFEIKPGTHVPASFYISTQSEKLEQDPTAKKVIIKKKSQFILTFLIDTPGTIISWNFKTAANDIAMGLNFKPLGSNDIIQLLPLRRIDCHKFVETGKVECNEIGTYELVFSNLYSMLTKKVLTYTTKVVNPKENEIRDNKYQLLSNDNKSTMKYFA